MYRNSLVPMLLGIVMTAPSGISALAQAPQSVSSSSSASIGAPATAPAASGVVMTTSAGSVQTSCTPVANASKPKHKGFGGFVKGLVKDHGVQALEIATGVGAVAMVAKGATSIAATNGLQAIAAQSQTAALARQGAGMSGMGNMPAALAASSMLSGGGRSTSAIAAMQAAQMASMQRSGGSSVGGEQPMPGAGSTPGSAAADCVSPTNAGGAQLVASANPGT